MSNKVQAAILVAALVVSGCIFQRPGESETPVVQYYTIYVSPSLQDHTMSVSADVMLQIPEAAEKIELCLNPEFSISSITDEQQNELTYEREYDVVTVALPPSSTIKTLTFQYEGQVYRRITEVTWDYIGEEGCWVRAEYNWYPVIPKAAEMGCHFWEYWYNNYWTGATLTEFWNYWHPSYWAGATISVDVPESWSVISTGTLTTETVHHSTQTKTCTWQEPQAVPGLTFVAGEYSIIRDTDITVYLIDSVHAQKCCDLTRKILDFYTEKFGEYPFEQLSIVELPRTDGYCQGKPSLIMLDSATLAQDEKTIAHAFGQAIACQWFGNTVSGYDTPSLISLEVCLSNYASLLFIQKEYGQEAFCSYLTSYRSEIEETFAEYGGASLTDESAFIRGRGRGQRNAVVLKTVLMFHALHEKVGDEHFFEALQNILADYRGKSITMVHLQEEFEQTTGESLDTFFQQYYYSIDIPDIAC
jgi:hypothetical protein